MRDLILKCEKDGKKLHQPTNIKPVRFSFFDKFTVVVEGDNEVGYDRQNLRCKFAPSKVDLPDELASIKEKVIAAQADAERKGESAMWNGETFALRRIRRNRTPNEESVVLHLEFGRSDWFTHCATGLSLDTEKVHDERTGHYVTLREKYLGKDVYDWEDPSIQPHPFFTNTFAIGMCLVTGDEKITMTRRSGEVVSAKRYNIFVNETVSPKDVNSHSLTPDLYITVERGADEELGIKGEQLKKITFLALCVGTVSACWAMQGIIETTLTFQEILHYRRLNAKDRWENDTFYAVDFDVESVCKFLKDHETEWNDGAPTCIYNTLVYKFGRADVDTAFVRFGIRC